VSSYDAIRQQHVAYWAQIMPDHVGRLHMSRPRLLAERERRLRALLALAALRSPFHRRRLSDLDLATVTEEDLVRIPPMTTDDLMANWDEIVTDPRLSLAAVDRHVADLTSDAYLLDEFHAVASGGSTGRRGVFVYGWNAWAAANAGFLRPMMWDRGVSPEVAAAPTTVAMVAAQNPAHMTSALGHTFANQAIQLRRFPVTLPVAEIVAGLNAYQPTLLIGYPTALAVLADEARRGALRISPLRLASTSEPLRPETRRSLEHEFGAPVANMYGTSEAGPVAVGCWRGPGMHLCDDMVIVEPVDSEGRPVEPGVLSEKVYLTPLTNSVLPLLRIELSDRIMVTGAGCPCGSAHTMIADVQGRIEDIFTYQGGVTVHPHAYASVLRRDPGVTTYQVRQTAAGADISVVGNPADPAWIERALADQLSRLGIAEPQVRITTVTELDRLSSGKVRSFVPLPAKEAARLAGGRPS
jgi:phenylacetate-coenzyme A ligase PaaK-like adenylate-forming protein